MKKIKVLFLDVDGVLNSYNGLIKRGGQGLMDIYIEHEKLLEDLVDRTEVKIVLSSTWRLGKSIDQIRSFFRFKTLQEAIIDKTPDHLKLYNFEGKDTSRGTEIQEWLVTKGSNVEDFIILDDNDDMCPYMDKLIQTDFNYGFTYIQYLEALDILLGKEYTKKYIWTNKN